MVHALGHEVADAAPIVDDAPILQVGVGAGDGVADDMNDTELPQPDVMLLQEVSYLDRLLKNGGRS